jgi:hypothetical protein
MCPALSGKSSADGGWAGRAEHDEAPRWEYINPFFGKPFFAAAPGTEGNLVFRALRYGADDIARAKATVRV